MAGKSPYAVVLTGELRAELERRAAAYSGPFRDVVRAKAILYAADGARIRRSLSGSTSPAKPCRIGEDVSARRGCRVLRRNRGRAKAESREPRGPNGGGMRRNGL
jgi:hypothetical protein